MLSPPPQALLGIIKPPVTEPRAFLQQHIQRDLEQLTQTLGKSADETASTVHHILCRLLQEQRHLCGQGEAAEGLSLRGVVEQVCTESRLAAHTAEGDGRPATPRVLAGRGTGLRAKACSVHSPLHRGVKCSCFAVFRD